MKRNLTDRLQDRLWREIGGRLAVRMDLRPAKGAPNAGASVSGTMPWADICTALTEGSVETHNFRRTTAVRDIVETVGPVEGRFYARRILEWGPEWLQDPHLHKIDRWGNPVTWPGILLGTNRAFSPTTLRYLATALWLKRMGLVTEGTEIIEIGVGFGGLAAMNALVSAAGTILVDLPQVENAAMRLLDDVGLGRFGTPRVTPSGASASLIISNYAFTELNRELQVEYFEKYFRRVNHGVIISNAAVFSGTIQGHTDDELLSWFRSEGLDASIERSNDLLGPGDHMSGVKMIRW